MTRIELASSELLVSATVAHSGAERRILDIAGAAIYLAFTERHVRRLGSERRIAYIKERTLLRLDVRDLLPKARHAKRRIIAAYTMRLVASCLHAGGHLLVATDHAAYAAHARAAKGLAAGRSVTELRADLVTLGR